MSDPANAYIDPETGLRKYRWQDRILTSVTSMRRVVGMPMPLAAWQMNQAIDVMLDDVSGLLAGRARSITVPQRRGEAYYDFEQRLRKAQRVPIRAAAMGERDRAADLGTAVHEAAERGLKSRGLPEDDDRKPFLFQYEDWLATKRPIIHVAEGQVFNLRESYAGSFDAIAEVDDLLTLIDYKTGKGTYADHAVQLSLYLHGEFVGAYEPLLDQDLIDEVASTLLLAVQQMAILHLRPEGWEWIVIPDTDELAAAALNMVRFARWLETHPTLESVINNGRNP